MAGSPSLSSAPPMGTIQPRSSPFSTLAGMCTRPRDKIQREILHGERPRHSVFAGLIEPTAANRLAATHVHGAAGDHVLGVATLIKRDQIGIGAHLNPPLVREAQLARRIGRERRQGTLKWHATIEKLVQG